MMDVSKRGTIIGFLGDDGCFAEESQPRFVSEDKLDVLLRRWWVFCQGVTTVGFWEDYGCFKRRYNLRFLRRCCVFTEESQPKILEKIGVLRGGTTLGFLLRCLKLSPLSALQVLKWLILRLIDKLKICLFTMQCLGIE